MSYIELTKNYIKALGGLDNIKTIDNCITRLRLEVNQMSKINEDKVIELGAKGIIYVGHNKFHLIIGTHVSCIADELHTMKKDGFIGTIEDGASECDETAMQYIQALGGVRNIERVDNCITRLRLKVHNMENVNEDELSKLHNRGIIHKSLHDLHIIIGLNVTSIADSMRNIHKYS